MAANIKVILCLPPKARDEYGQVMGWPIPWRQCYCEVTRSGGSMRTFAGRLASEYSMVLSTLWQPGIEEIRYVDINGKVLAVDDIVPECRPGRHKMAHIVTQMRDMGYGG